MRRTCRVMRRRELAGSGGIRAESDAGCGSRPRRRRDQAS
ncbi:Uncharacterised protein [Amycolatopsis camponoti]|uniref:Uncharacterized protein n=1 Tax=Amycolatopsis camponoti TaxID=2606593 RepID=A0A6I8LT89_9PSEU|nr:Uncharacterised protein [Amycolatopsis camponoti]